MNTLDLVLANDSVLKSGTVRKLEDSISVTAFRLTSALDTTTVGLHATIENTGDLLGLLVGDRALGGGDREGSTLLELEELGGGGALNGRSSNRGANEGEDGGSDGELHFDSRIGDGAGKSVEKLDSVKERIHSEKNVL